MAFNVSIVLDDLGYLEPDAGMEVHGANLSISGQLKEFGRREEVATLEIFVPLRTIVDRPSLEKWASLILPKSRQGRGILRFLPITSLPEVWADGAERILWSRDPWWLPRERFLRDRFAVGPTPLMVDTHSLGQHDQNEKLALMRGAPRVDFDVVCALTNTVSEAYRRIFTNWLTPGEPPLFSLRVLPHSVDCKRFSPVSVEGRLLARKSLNLPSDGTIGLYFGRLTPNSKADLLPLLHAFKGVARSGRHLAIGGVENVAGYVSRLKKEAESLGIADQVHFFSEISPSMRHLVYAAADFFVFPGDTVQEALGNTLLEAAASGLPTLLSDWDGMKEASVAGVTGIHVPAYWMPCHDKIGALLPVLPQMTSYLLMAQSVWIDPEKLADGLETLFADEKKRKEMGDRGREMAVEKFSQDAVWAKTMEIWSEALERARQESPEEKARRKDHASRFGLAMPIIDIFSHYATGVIDPAQDSLHLTAYGESCLGGKVELQFYDECLALVNPKSLSALRSIDWTRPQLVGNVAFEMSEKSGAEVSDSLMHIAFLLKRGVFSLTKGE